jgi:hypothetical protein
MCYLCIEGEKNFTGNRVGGVDHGAMLAAARKFSIQTVKGWRKAAKAQRKRVS